MAPKKRVTAPKKPQPPLATSSNEPNVHQSEEKNLQNSSSAEAGDEHILLQLPISDSHLNKLLSDQDMTDILQYDPLIKDPVPYIPDDYFSHNADVINKDVMKKTHDVPDEIPKTDATYTNGAAKRQKICFWCCHEVGHMTFGMPIRYDFLNKSFTMYGTFCSLECAAAHNFAVHLGSDRAWEIHSWIQMIGKRFGYVEPIRPAPSRYLLQMFDGPLSIDEFRNAHKGQTRTYVLNIPPLISVTSQMEVVNTSFLGNTEAKVGSYSERPQRKLADKRKTLDSKMNLTIKEESI
jgi:hypothetical protein